ncbi:MAG: site-specific DNA-methyltransferase [Planctomycetes bacterium]|nr:site-specific DNA-methyltransferase [Planctomycetota bacterium]
MTKADTSTEPDLTHIVPGLRALAVPIASLTLDPANARLHSERNLEAIQASLVRFGQRAPVVVQKKGMVVRAGNGRVAAARALGWTHIAALLVDDGDAEATAYAIADNRTSELAAWDEAALARLLRSLEAEDGIDVAVTGFTRDEVDRLFAEAFPEEAAPPMEDEVPPPPVEAVTRPGDLWVLGEHRLLCGDARQAEDVDRLLEGAALDCMWTDPPYGVNYVGGTRDALQILGDDPSGLMPLLHEAFVQADRVMRPGASFYIAHPAGALSVTFGVVVQQMGWHLHQTLVWVKDALVLGHSDYHYRHEPILYGWRKGATRAWYGGRDQDTVLEHPRPRASPDHPCTKPVGLVARGLRNSTRSGDVVYDPFAGSGTTLLACEHLGRRARALEIDPRYCDVVVRRWEALTETQAEREV